MEWLLKVISVEPADGRIRLTIEIDREVWDAIQNGRLPIIDPLERDKETPDARQEAHKVLVAHLPTKAVEQIARRCAERNTTVPRELTARILAHIDANGEIKKPWSRPRITNFGSEKRTMARLSDGNETTLRISLPRKQAIGFKRLLKQHALTQEDFFWLEIIRLHRRHEKNSGANSPEVISPEVKIDSINNRDR